MPRGLRTIKEDDSFHLALSRLKPYGPAQVVLHCSRNRSIIWSSEDQ